MVGATVTRASAASLAGAGIARRLGAPWWACGVAAVYAGSVSPAVRPMRATARAWQERSRTWRNLLVTGTTARGVHDLAGGVQPAILRALDALEPLDPDAASLLRARLGRVRGRAAVIVEPWRDVKDSGLLAAMNEGYLAGRSHAAVTGAPLPVRAFAVYENTPSWLPRPARRSLVPVLRVIDVVRLIHTEDIERRALVATLWLRATVVVVAPLTAHASFTGAAPSPRDALWLTAAGGAVLAAGLSPQLLRHTVGRPTRWRLYGTEQLLASAAVIVAPCWAVAVGAAGAVNWIERPEWTLRRLMAWMGLTYVPLALSGLGRGAPAQAVVLESMLGIAITALMAGSYGLMAPVTALTGLRALMDSMLWRLRALRVLERERRQLRALMTDLERRLRAHAASDAEAQVALRRIHEAQGQLQIPWDALRRQPRRLGDLLGRAIADVVVPEEVAVPAGAEPAVRGAMPLYRPATLASRRIADGRDARRLAALVRRVLQEAVDKGAEGLISTYVRDLPRGGVEIEVANALPDRTIGGFGTGDVWLEQARVAIPGACIVTRGRRNDDHPELYGKVFSVIVHLAGESFD